MTKPENRPSSKVAGLIEEYELAGLGADLEARWTADGDERMSLRNLATYFNERLVEQTLRDAGMSALERDIQRTYRSLTDEDISAGVRTDTRTELDRKGVDVDRLERDFVTYQAIRSYLTEYRDAEYKGPSDKERLDSDRETIQRLASRTLSVTEDRLKTLRKTGRLDLDEFEVLLDLQVLCQFCGRQHSVDELFDQEGCECQHEG